MVNLTPISTKQLEILRNQLEHIIMLHSRVVVQNLQKSGVQIGNILVFLLTNTQTNSIRERQVKLKSFSCDLN